MFPNPNQVLGGDVNIYGSPHVLSFGPRRESANVEPARHLVNVEPKRESENRAQRRGPGNVFLVGTGPGDPELLTVKALRVIQSADLLLYDRLVSNDVLNLAGLNARLLYVGKTAGYHSRTQIYGIVLRNDNDPCPLLAI
ncbi:urophorphyrin methylase 1 [Abeliophyllum distichum]|uniref:uroporphyrinogen-III C-methyltransferase n=1 Tax=Abeliophyllum distichum TaxID=126358 RepID=A0ABD1SWZ0_9LAMI